MPEGTPARSETSSRESMGSHRPLLDPGGFIEQIVADHGRSRGAILELVIGPLAALLIAKWIGYDESEREANAALDDPILVPTLPAALRRSTWEHPTAGQADAVVDAFRAVTARQAPADASVRYLSNVAPLVTSAAEQHGSLVKDLVQWVCQAEIGTPRDQEVAARLFDEMLQDVMNRFESPSNWCATPGPVAALMLDLANPAPGERVYDPCFGIGGVLMGAVRRLHAAALTDSPNVRTDTQRTGIFGVEINRFSYAIALCRTLLAGIKRPGLELGDALDRPLPVDRSADGFDCILAVPPWGRRLSQTSANPVSPSSHGMTERAIPERADRQFPFPSRDVDNLFLQHAMANLRPDGRAVIAVPERTLYRGGADQEVRRALLTKYCLDAVVSLPVRAFAPYTRVPTSLLFFRRQEPRPTVRFVRISTKAWNTSWVDGNGDGGRSDLPCQLATLVRRQGLIDGSVPAGVEAWEVPIRDLARRDHELVAKQTGHEALQAELERIVGADRSLAVERLDAVADIRRGLPYKRCFTTESRPAPGAPGLIRLRDIADAEVRRPSLFLNGEGKPRFKEGDLLRAGDVVVTMSHTVGKVGLVQGTGGAVGSVAAGSLAVVRARAGVTSHYLTALLRSPAYQNWLSGHARGGVIRHLSIRMLNSLPIPVPPVPIQDALIGEINATRGDALAALVRLFAGTPASPLEAWLETPFVARMAAGRLDEEPDRIGVMEAVAHALLSLGVKNARGSQLAFSDDGDRRIGAWFGAARLAAAALHGVASIPRGAGLLAAMEVARSRLYEAQYALAATEEPTVNRLRSFTRAVIGLAEEEVRAMQESVTVRVGFEPASVVVGIESEVRLRLTNSSAVPLRDLAVGTRPAIGSARIPYLAEGATHDVPLTVRADDATRALQLVVSWQARRLDGTPVRNEEEIELHVRSTREAVRSRDLGASPYIVGNPVDRQEMFFGRADVIERIRRQVGANTHANVVLLEGNRRTGKTSILRQLAKPDTLPGWIPVDCSLQDAEGDGGKPGISTRNLYRLLARKTGWTLYDTGVETWFPQLPERAPNRPFKVAFRRALDEAFADEQPFETFGVYIAAAVQAASPRRILLMLDEFDKLQEGIDAGVTSPQAPENIRHLLQHQAGLSAIITGSLRLKRLREEYWSALFGLGCRIPISALPDRDAKRLVTEPVADRLDYLPQARDRVVELTSRHPFLMQSLCNQVFEQAAEMGRTTVTLELVEEASNALVRDNEHFRTLWGYAGNERRRLLLALCDKLAKGPDPVNLDLLDLKLEEHGVSVHLGPVLADDLTALRELELVEYADSPRGGNYRLAVPLMAKWLQHNVDFDDIVRRARQEAMES